MRLRNWLEAFLRFCMQVLFVEITRSGVERVPRRGPLVYVANHVNGLIDPALLLCLTPRQVSFMAKAPLFSIPLIGWFTRGFDSIPVYRPQDDPTQVHKNQSTFVAAGNLLRKGGVLALFPEGVSHNRPCLQALRSGTARILIGAEVPDVKIVPIGIHFDHKDRWRSRVHLHFGEPFESCESRPELMARIQTALENVSWGREGEARWPVIAEQEAKLPTWRERVRYRIHALTSPTWPLADAEPISESTAQDRSSLAIERWALRILCAPMAALAWLIYAPFLGLLAFLARYFARGETDLILTHKLVGSVIFLPMAWVFQAGILASLIRPVGIENSPRVWLLAFASSFVLAVSLSPVFFWAYDRSRA